VYTFRFPECCLAIGLLNILSLTFAGSGLKKDFVDLRRDWELILLMLMLLSSLLSSRVVPPSTELSIDIETFAFVLILVLNGVDVVSVVLLPARLMLPVDADRTLGPFDS
jgi:hypothetical protein